MLTRFYQKKESLPKKACERNQNLSEEEKTKSISKPVNHTETFLKNINMFGNAIKIFLKMKNKGLV